MADPDLGDLTATVAALAARVADLEDRWALLQLVATYGPAVDSGRSEVVAGLWTEDGVYDVDTPGPLRGRGEIRAMVEGEGHQGLIHAGAGHVMSLPHIEVDGDRAVATNHSRLYTNRGDGFGVWRVCANRWECVRTPEGWRIETRINRPLDGSEYPRALLGRGIAGGS